MATIRIQTEDFDLAAEMTALTRRRTDVGGVGCFVGIVRDNHAHPLKAMTLEHYPGMTEQAMVRIAAEAEHRWALLGCTLIHRVGRLEIGANIVLVIAAAAHRQAALDATAFLIDWLKTSAPFWKRESLMDGTSRWVDARTEDDAAASRWGLTGRTANAGGVITGALLLVWPAMLNHYPIVFSDLGGLLSMGHLPEIGWDKPWVYGPFLRVTDAGLTLWLPVLVQGVVLSHLLWLVQKAVAEAAAWRHLALCAVLAAGSAAPWFAALLMPDIFAPVAVLCLFLLGFAPSRALSRWEFTWVGALASFAVAVHLAHLVVACGCLAAVTLLRWRRLPACIAPLVVALAWLLVTNAAGNGVLGVSPYGSIFALARLQADGPAARYLQEVCPAAGYRLCTWAARLPEDSDKFLWDPDGPVWEGDYGPTLMVNEAKQVVAGALAAYPGMASLAAARNTLAQTQLVAVGDTLIPDYLDSTVLPRLQAFFPPDEAVRFTAGLQARGALVAASAPFLWPQIPLLAAGLAGALLVIPLAWRRRPGISRLALVILAGLLANAFATGALSKPHHRYQARIAWLVLLPPLLMLAPPRKSA